MNKKKAITLICIGVCLLSTGCGNMQDSSVTDSTSEASTSATTAEVAEAETTETSAETIESTSDTETASETKTASADSAEVVEATSHEETDTDESADNTPTSAQAKEIIGALNMLERLDGCGLQFDADTVYTVNGTVYHKVTVSDFTDTASIRSYEEMYLTQDMINERYSNIVDGDSPAFIDAEDGLYMKDSARGFYIFSDTEPKIEKTSEEGYSILAEYDNFGETTTADIRIINVDGTWKISGISFGI